MNDNSPMARIDDLTPSVSTASLVGRYMLDDVIGEGGMGVVRRAHDSCLDREVAVKLLKPGATADSHAAARFVHEAKITGQLQHPGIPAVHDLGTMPNGLPFLAMKLVKGQTLQALLRERAMPCTDLGRLIAIFEQACHAVGYAHTHNVIHRDLKPSNVMVGAHGEVQLMDWGLAKVLGELPIADREAPDDPAATTDLQAEIGTMPGGARTRTGSVLGTLSYMAPEQASGDIRKLDARSDVFALGAILCEILTGQSPYGVGDAHEVKIRAIRGQMGEALARLDACAAEPALVNLCKRCLAMKKENRPDDGGTVAAEVAAIREESETRARQAELHRERTAVQAVEETKRRRVLAVAAGTVAAVLAIGAGVSAWQAVRARTAEATARTEAATARTREAQERQAREGETNARETAEAVAKFMKEVFSQASARGQQSPTRTANRNLTVKDAMDFAANSIAGQFPSHPNIEAAIRTAIGETYVELAAFPEANEQLTLALAIQENSSGPDHPDTLLCVNNLGHLRYQMGDLPAAEALYRRALSGQETRLGPDHPDTLATSNNLAALLYAKGDLPAAEPFYKRTLAGREKVLGPDHPQTLQSANNLAIYLRTIGDLATAESLLRRTLDGCEKTLGPDHADTLSIANNLGESLRMRGDYAAAEPLYRRALAGQESILGPDHPDTLGTVNNLAVLLYTRGDLADAEPLLQRALAGKEKALGPEHPDVLLGVNNLAVVNFSLGRYSAAVPLFDRALRGYEKRPEGVFPASVTQVYLGLALLGAGEPAAAEPHLLAGYNVLTAWKGLDPKHRKWPRMAAQGLVELYESTDQTKAGEWREKLAALPPEIPIGDKTEH